MRQTSERHKIPEIQGTLGPPSSDSRQQTIGKPDQPSHSPHTLSVTQPLRDDLSQFLRNLALERNIDNCRNMIGSLTPAELAYAKGDKVFKDGLSDWAKNIVLREKTKADPGALIDVARKLSVIYQAGINFESHREQPFTTQTLVYALQLKAPRESCKFTAAALECGAAVAPTMTLVTLRKAIEAAHSIEDLKAAGKLAVAALHSKPVIQHPDTAGTYNVITAKLCQTDLDVVGRISPLYKETDIVDIAHRMVIGSEILTALVIKGVIFDSEDSEGRVNMSIRAFAAVAAATHIEGIKDQISSQILPQNRPVDIVSSLRDELDIDLEWQSAELSKHRRTNYDAISIVLLERAIDLADKCLVWRANSKPIERYKIEGSTINSLFYAIAQAELPLTLERCEQLSSILEKAVHVKEINSKLYSKAIAGVLNEIAFTEEIPEKKKTSLLVHIATEAPYVRISKPLLTHILERYEAAHPSTDDHVYPPPEDFFAVRRLHSLVGKAMPKAQKHASAQYTSSPENGAREYSTGGWFSSLLSVSTPGLEILRNHADETSFS